MSGCRLFVTLPTGGWLLADFRGTREELDGVISELRARPDGSRPTIEIREKDDDWWRKIDD